MWRASPRGSDYPTDLDALLVTLPNTLQQAEVDRLTEYAGKGNPLLVAVDTANPRSTLSCRRSFSPKTRSTAVRPRLHCRPI